MTNHAFEKATSSSGLVTLVLCLTNIIVAANEEGVGSKDDSL